MRDLTDDDNGTVVTVYYGGSGYGPIRATLMRVPKWVWIAVVVFVAAFVGLVFDGIRRENLEMTALLDNYSGEVLIIRSPDQTPGSPDSGTRLREDDVVVTGGDGNATLVFSDGSAILVEPNTRFRIRLLDYARGGRRDRSFMVNCGSVVSRVSHIFGAESRETICTPNAVAAARGTGYRVAFNPDSKTSLLQVDNGKVEFSNGSERSICRAGYCVDAKGYTPGKQRALTAPEQLQLGRSVNGLQKYERHPNLLQRTELNLNTFIEPVLQRLKAVPGGKTQGMTDAQMRAACKRSLRELCARIENQPGKVLPDYINPVTLDGLAIGEAERESILSGFSGNMIESYQKLANNRYQVTVRAKDKARSVFQKTGKVTPTAKNVRPSTSKPAMPQNVSEAYGPQPLDMPKVASLSKAGTGFGMAGIPPANVPATITPQEPTSEKPVPRDNPPDLQDTIDHPVADPQIAGVSDVVFDEPVAQLTFGPALAGAPLPIAGLASTAAIAGPGAGAIYAAAAGLGLVAVALKGGSNTVEPDSPIVIPEPNGFGATSFGVGAMWLVGWIKRRINNSRQL